MMSLTLRSQIAPLGAEYKPAPAVLVGFAFLYYSIERAVRRELQVVTSNCNKLGAARQLADLNGSILQAKVSVDVELSKGAEDLAKIKLTKALENECDEDYDRLYEAFVENGGGEGGFEDPVDWDGIAPRVEGIVASLKSRVPQQREIATANAISLGVDPRLVLSSQLLHNSGCRRHSEKLPDLEKRARLLSAEYREVQKSRPIDVVPVSGDRENARRVRRPPRGRRCRRRMRAGMG